MDLDEFEDNKNVKKRMRPISSCLDQLRIYYMAIKITFLRDQRGKSRAGRRAHLAHLSSQSELTIHFILPAGGFSHITMSNY